MNEKEDIFVNINDRYIIPELNSHVLDEKIVMGYYIYEDGEFKFIERFLTGEKVLDEEGNYNENFQKQPFTVGGEGGIGTMMTEEGRSVSGKIRFLKRNTVKDDELFYYTYDIEIVGDDTKLYPLYNPEDNIVLPSNGTVIRNVR